MNGVRGMKGFMLIWTTQIVSILASSMTGFGLSIWMFERTGSFTAMSILQICGILPFLLFSPIAGALVDRLNRKLMMAMSDLVAVVGTAGILVLHAFGALQEWHLWAAAVLNGIGNCFQWPAYTATITVMIPKEHHVRANALSGIMEAGPGVIAPTLAAAALPILGLSGIMALDVATFALALGALLLVVVPTPAREAVPDGAKKPSLLSDAGFGFRYIFANKPLVALLLTFMVSNFFGGFAIALSTPMVLGLTGMDKWALGATQTAFAIGGLAGGVVVGAWGGFKNRPFGVVSGIFVILLLGNVVFALGGALWVWIACGVGVGLGGALANASSQAIWQAKVPAGMQGRVFSARRLIAWVTGPLVPALAGPLADFVFEPMMKGQAAPAFLSALFGSGTGSGAALLICLTGCVGLAAPLLAWSSPLVRRVDELIPDCVTDTPAEEQGA